MRRRRGASNYAALDAVKDRRHAEEIEGDIKIVIGYRRSPCAAAICGDVLFLVRNVRSVEIDASRFLENRRRHTIYHRVIDKIGERMAERRQFPVEHRDHLGSGRMKDE